MRVLIHGSCISRDSFELAQRRDVELVGYSARSSLVSSFARRPTDLSGAAGNVQSSFQRRMLEADAAKSLPRLLRTLPYDLLLLDLVDERFNVWARGEERLTDSPALRESGFLERKQSAWQRLESGSDQHFEGWNNSLKRMLGLMAGLDRPRAVAFLDAEWATAVAGRLGSHELSYAGRAPDHSNALYARYHDVVRSVIPQAHVIRPPLDITVSDPNHKWGLAPFHYVQEFYDFVGERLVEIANQLPSVR